MRRDAPPNAVLDRHKAELGAVRRDDGRAILADRTFPKAFSSSQDGYKWQESRAALAEGQLMTPQMLLDLMAGLGRSVPAEILPARVLVRNAIDGCHWHRHSTSLA